MGKMNVPVLNTCCGCCSLKTGTIVCAVYGIISSLLMIIIMWTTSVEWKMIIDIGLSQTVIKIIMTFLFVMTIIISTLLLAGALKKNIMMMFPWIVLAIMCIIGSVVTVLYNAIVLIIAGAVASGIGFLIGGFIGIAIALYMWFVAYSYFRQIQFEKESGHIGPYGRPMNYRHP